MEQHNVTTTDERSIWLRGLLMLLMGMVFQLCGTLLGLLAIIQFIFVLVTDAPNARLLYFGRSLALYFRQIVAFLSFASEQAPFPFNDWPASD